MDIASLGIRVTTTGAKEAVRDLDQLDKSGTRTAQSAKALGVALGGIVAGGAALAAVGMRKYFQNTIDAERVQAQLEARLKSTGHAAGVTAGELNKMAAQLQFSTSFDDESIGGAQALLLTFTKIGKDVFPRATEAVLDMSTALGGDLNSAAMQVGKALNDPVAGITALSRAGVTFTDSQKEMIKKLAETGQVAKAQALILKELETQMGGSAKAARDTLGGALQSLGNSFDNLLEGDSGSAGIKGTRDAIEGFNRTLNDPGIKRGVDSAASGILQIANSAIQLIGALGNAGSALSEFFAANDRKSAASLLNRRNDLEGKLFAEERAAKSPLGAPLAKVRNNLGIGADSIRAEIAEIEQMEKAQREAARRSQAAALASAAVAESIRVGRGPGKVESLTLDTGKKDKAKAAAKRELTDAEKAYQDIMETGLLIDEQVDEFRRSAISLEYAKAAAIDQGVERAGQMLSDMQFELSLIGLSNEAREKAIALRYADANATAEQITKIGELAVATSRAREQQAFADETQRSLSDALGEYVGRTKSAKDAFGDFADSLYQRSVQLLADKAVQALFDMFNNQGAAGGGAAASGASGGGGWASTAMSLFSSFFGGGRAIGGPVHAGGMYEVGERNKPELLQMHGKSFLIPGNEGKVSPMTGAPAQRISNFSQTVVVQGLMGRHTPAQLAIEASREQTRQSTRNR